jgi:hypothetical protein
MLHVCVEQKQSVASCRFIFQHLLLELGVKVLIVSSLLMSVEGKLQSCLFHPGSLYLFLRLIYFHDVLRIKLTDSVIYRRTVSSEM